MIRNLKVMGLAVMAVLALSAMVASAASAQNGRITSTGNVTLTGTEITGKKNAVTAFGLTAVCPGSTGTGHKYNVTPHTFIPSGAEVFTLTPHLIDVSEGKPNCRVNSFPATTAFNGCDYVSHIGQTTGVADQYAGTLDFVCPEGKEILWTVWFNDEDHKNGKEPCVIHIPPQTGMKGGTITDTTTGDLELGGPISGVKMIETKNLAHPLLCPAREGEAEIDIALTVKGDNEFGENTAISLSHL